MTLLELTVVILVLLTLISILFVGASAWKKGSDRAANIMNIRNSQVAMRGHANMYQLEPGDAFSQNDLEQYIKFPKDIGSSVTYTAGTQITPQSENPATSYSHIWLIPSVEGLPTAGYGQSSYDDSTGW